MFVRRSLTIPLQQEVPGSGVKRNGWADKKAPDDTGYRDVMFSGMLINGMAVELQLNTPEMLAAKSKAHKLYEEAEALRRKKDDPATNPADVPALKQQIARKWAEQRAIYKPAYDLAAGKNLDRQTDSETGSPSPWSVDNPKLLGSSGMSGRNARSQATGPPPGPKVTGTPLTSQNEVPDGNLDGGVSKSAAPEAIQSSPIVDPEGIAEQADSQPDSSAQDVDMRPGRNFDLGDFRAVMRKDGSMFVRGDVDAIRTQLPDGVVGRPSKTGLEFTPSAAPRARAALSGKKLAYGRAGTVVKQLPMKGGKYVGAPEKFNSPAKIPQLRKLLRQLADEGAPGRYWYENSSKSVLQFTAGNVQDARKFVALLAIYSPQAKVDANSTFALRAWAQYKSGQPIKVKTSVQDQKATEAMDDVDAFWSGEKTGNFFFNLLAEIDPATRGKQGATIDMWMMRAGQYSNDAPTATQYAFMENETNRLAAELGWEPQQVQAAICVAMKARMENAGVKKRTESSSEKAGWITYEYPVKNGRPNKQRKILDAQKHRDNWLKHAFAHDPTTDDTQGAKFDFGDGLSRHIGQISFEARPGRSTGLLPGIHSAPYAQQVEFQQAVQAAFYDEQGNDLLAAKLGLLVASNDIMTPGVWQGDVSPSQQKLVAMAPNSGSVAKNEVDPAQKQLLSIYAAIAGLVGKQEGVGWHRPFYATTKRDANGLDIDIGRALNPAEAIDLERAIDQWMQSNGKVNWVNEFAIVSSPNGVRLVNFGAVENAVLHSDVLAAAAAVLPSGKAKWFTSDGDLVTNDWTENPDGQNYIDRARAEGRPDVLEWATAVLAPRIEAVYADFGKRYGWDQQPADAGSRYSRATGDGGGRQESRSPADRPLEAPEQADASEGLSPLPGAPSVRGFTGPDPRLVAVAEQYARSIGLTLRRQAEYVDVDQARAVRIADAYSAMPHAPNDPKVREAYSNLIKQTTAQYRALEKAGYKFWFIDLSRTDNQEYASTPWNAMRDIRASKQMGVFPTVEGFGSNADVEFKDNPLEQATEFKWPKGGPDGPLETVYANDLFRAVHDAFGHGLEGAGFRAQGEENAWQAHIRLFTGSAVGAITSETRGQNSWLNYGPNGESNRTAQVEDTVFADQKTGLMPEWTWQEGVVGDQPAGTRSANARYSQPVAPFYSALAREVDSLKMNAGPAAGWKGVIKGMVNKGSVKADEVEWTGINDWLDLQQGKVSKDQVTEYLNQGGVRVEETVLGQGSPEIEEFLTINDMRAEPEGRSHWFVESPTGSVIVERSSAATEADAKAFGVRYFNSQISTRNRERRRDALATKYGQYTLPGGENYREVLLTLPVKQRGEIPSGYELIDEAERARADGLDIPPGETGPWTFRGPGVSSRVYKTREEALAALLKSAKSEAENGAGAGGYYRSSHWDQPNILAHIRLNDRTDADGKRVLFVEEAQSDWGQEGKKSGFSNTRLNMQSPVVVFNARTGENVARFRTGEAAEAYIAEQDPTMATLDYEDTTGRGGVEAGMVPAAPFVTKTEGWLNLALKRVITIAANEGYDKVAFVNGQQSADRYDLSKQIDRIDVYLRPNGTYDLDVSTSSGQDFNRSALTEAQLEDNVGKEMARKIVSSVSDTERRARFSNLDLKIGGEGMKTFYDQIVPNAVKKLLPKVGGQGLIAIDITGTNREPEMIGTDRNGEAIYDDGSPDSLSQTGFDVTDAMREKAAGGLPLFSRQIDTFVKSYRAGKEPRQFVTVASSAPSHVLMTAQLGDIKGWGRSRPVTLSGWSLNHIKKGHPEIDDSIYARLPSLLENPRAVLIHKRTEKNKEGDAIGVIVRERAADSNPILVALRPGVGSDGTKQVKVTDVRTAMGWDQSASRVVEALREGRVGYLPKEEVARVRDLLAGSQSPTAAGQSSNLPNPKPISGTATRGEPVTSAAFRGRTVSVPSDASLVEYRKTGSIGGALADSDIIGIPDNWRQLTEGVRFSKNIPTPGAVYTLPKRSIKVNRPGFRGGRLA
jgi:hypothetical protein